MTIFITRPLLALGLSVVLPFARCANAPSSATHEVRRVACEAGGAYEAERLLARPDVHAWLPQQRWYPDAHANVSVLRDGSGEFIVAALGWEGPAEGALLLFSCDGRLLDVEPTAGIDTLDVVPLDAPLPALARLHYRVGGATSYRNEGVELWVVRDSTLHLAWSAPTFEGDYSGERPREDSAKVYVERDGRVIRGVYRRRHRVVELGFFADHYDRYDWNEDSLRFVRRTTPR